MVIYENLRPFQATTTTGSGQNQLMPPPSAPAIPRIPPPPPSSNRTENHQNYHQSSQLYVCSAEVRSRKRYGICGGAGSAELTLTPKKNNNNGSLSSSGGGASNANHSYENSTSPAQNQPNFELKAAESLNFSLSRQFNNSYQPHYHQHPLPLQHETALQIWLQELQSQTEAESLTALQAKSVATTPESFEALSIRNAQVAIQTIRRQSSAAIDELDCLLDCLPVSVEGLAYLHESFSGCTGPAIISVLESCRRKGADYAASGSATRTGDVAAIVEQTRVFLAGRRTGGTNSVNNAQIEATVRRLREAFGELVDVTLKKECALLVGSLTGSSGSNSRRGRRPRSHLVLKWSLLALWQLTQKDPYMVRLLLIEQQQGHSQPNCQGASSGGIIESLLELAQDYEGGGSSQEAGQIKAAALRVLTYLSSNRAAVRTILRALSSSSNSPSKKLQPSSYSFSLTSIFKSLEATTTVNDESSLLKEAVGLLVQLTTPFIDSKEGQQQQKHSSWEESAESTPLAPKWLVNELVAVLTEVARRHSINGQVFLMAAAALANITFLSTEALVKHETLGVLVGAARQLKQGQQQQQNSHFNYHPYHHHHYHHHQSSADHLLQDQIITLLANMAAKHPLEVVSSGGLIYLLDALLHDENDDEDEVQDIEVDYENAATSASNSTLTAQANRARIQQKIAVAVARLATNRSCAKIILKLGGLVKLVRLCKCPAERCHSDTVLLAAIAALKRLASAVGRAPFRELGAADLVDEKLQASFQAYSSRGGGQFGGPSCESLV